MRGCGEPHRQFASVDEELTRPRELRAARPPARLRQARRDERADELLDAFGLTDAADRLVQRLLRRHAPAPRHRRQHRRHARAAVPRRADDRARPAEPQPGLGHRPRPRRRGHDRAADDAVPRRGRPARRAHRHHRPRPGHRRRHARRAQGARSAPARCTCACATPTSAPTPQRVLARRCSATRVQLESDPAALSARDVDAERVGQRARRARARAASPSPSSPSASPASTRCSSPSPDIPPTTHRRRRRGGRGMTMPPTTDTEPVARGGHAAHRRSSTRAATARGRRALARVADVRLAGDAEDQARADAAVRRDRVPDHVRAALHVPVRWRARRLAARVPAGAAARRSS